MTRLEEQLKPANQLVFVYFQTQSKTLIFSGRDYLRWLISVSPAEFFPGPQLCLRKGDRDRMEVRKMADRSGTSVKRSFFSSSSVSPDAPGDVGFSWQGFDVGASVLAWEMALGVPRLEVSSVEVE